MEATLKRKLKRGELLIGTIITLPSPEIAEIYAQAGFDWLFVDLEHSVLESKRCTSDLAGSIAANPLFGAGALS